MYVVMRIQILIWSLISDAEPEPPILERLWSRSRFFGSLEPEPSFLRRLRGSKKEKSFSNSKLEFREMYEDTTYDPYRFALGNDELFQGSNDKFKCMEPEQPFICLELQSTQYDRRRSRLQDLGYVNLDIKKCFIVLTRIDFMKQI